MISPLAHVDPSAKIGANVTIHPFAYIDKEVEIGDGCEIKPYASVLYGTRLGKNNKVYQCAIVGAEPQDFRWKGTPAHCIIGNDNIIRENVIINRGFIAEQGTFVGDGNVIMAKSHIGHDSRIEGKCVLGNGVTIAGDCIVNQCAILSSNVVVHENSRIGRWVLVKGGCRVAGNVPPFIIVAHNPVAYYGVNAFVMRKNGFSEHQISEIAKAYRNVYQSGISVYNALQRIEADVEPSDERTEILNFIRSNDLRVVALPIDLLD